jgi:hypothetical protein
LSILNVVALYSVQKRRQHRLWNISHCMTIPFKEKIINGCAVDGMPITLRTFWETENYND